MEDVTVIKAVRNNRCKGKVQILGIDRFNSFLYHAEPGSKAVLKDNDGNVLRVFVKTLVDHSKSPYYHSRCTGCVFGRTLAKRNHCDYMRCWLGYGIKDIEEVLEDL